MSVFSVAGSPARGSFMMKPLIGSMLEYSSSSSRPSMRSGACDRTARTVVFPAASGPWSSYHWAQAGMVTARARVHEVGAALRAADADSRPIGVSGTGEYHAE
ncbi:MAG: hypothetical protein AB7N65_25370 [Vicinamibacterales bacterium]